MILETVFVLGLLFALLLGGVWIGLALFALGWATLTVFTDTLPGPLMANTTWGAASAWSLTALPMFIWMGEILTRSRVSEDMFRGLVPWLNRLPGRLLHCNVVGCGIFAAICGSSAATAATIGRMTVPELTRRGYDERMVIGSLAGSGTLGLMIPPSIMMIVYGITAEVSIARLFIAGVLPGLLLILLFSGFIAIWALRNPERVPAAEARTSLKEKLWASRLLIPTIILIAAIIGSIYTGVATPTEAAALGVVGSLILSLVSGSMSWKVFWDSAMAATRISCMIGFIIASAGFLTTATAFIGLPAGIAQGISDMGLTPGGLIIVLTIIFIILGCFLDGVSMIVLTSAVLLPTVTAAGIDLIWFGIFVILVVEMAQITPPVGFNLFVLQSLTGRDMFTIARATLPFFFLLLLAVAILWFAPWLAVWLPKAML
ncbi:TRAP dicarboxylate transporter, DctM subunit, unknown substrate 5 [plant metagenome]|uniref:TRAP C4-dicarboxylate transport system permease DctM subunit domain-containing protein n=1 Tax=plant metagenome TaxID=1297885 RepID=A0A484RTH3_9ZZZZ